jgi:hypothetical protein
MTNFYKNAIYNMTDSNSIAISVKSKDAASNRNFMVPAYSRPLTGMESGGDPGTAFKARPIKHWRKQLNPRTDSNGNAISGVNGRRAGIVGYMDVPGGSTVLGKTACNTANTCTSTATILSDNILRPNDDKWCCNTNSDGVINRINVNGYIGENVKYTASTILKPNYYSDRKSYLQSRCLLYEQRLSGARLNGVNYVVNGIIQTPNGTNRVEQRATENCLSQKCTGTSNPNTAITIYKPSNYQYATQGAVDSSSRIARLKYNTITKGGYQAAVTAFGTAGGSANSTYNGSDVSPNFLKNRNNNAPCTFTRKGSKTSACFKAMDIYTPTPPEVIGVVINFSVPYNGVIYYSANEEGYYTINGGSERFTMPLGVDQNINLTGKNATSITIYNTSITVLILNDCGLIAVPNLSSLTTLTYLDLGNNTGLVTFTPANFPPNITVLYLNDCGLIAVPNLSSLTNLTYLNLGNNTGLVTYTPANFPPNITTLILNNCGLIAVPILTSLTTLTELYLGNNSIVQLGGVGSGSFNDFKLTPGAYLQTLINGSLDLTGQGLTPAGTNLYGVWTTYT